MKRNFAIFFLSALAGASVPAQGLITFSAGVTSVTKISTNSVIGGGATGLIAGAGNYRFALFYSTTATSVNGQTAAIAGGASYNYYAFNDSSWHLAAYGTNTATAGRFAAIGATANGTVVPGVPGGASAQFVVIGWSANIGSDIPAVLAWINSGQEPIGVMGQSAVSGPIILGDGGIIATPPLFGTGNSQISGFTLGFTDGLTYWVPYIYGQPTNLTVTVGSTASFSVLATGGPTPSYQWSFNDTNIAGATNSSLVIPSVQLTNAGNYSVFISNYLGSVTSSNALLTVESSGGTPPSIVTQPAAATVPAGSNTTFTVLASGSTPLIYQWNFNGTNLVNATNAMLALNNVQPTNAGNYSVTITNAYGATNSAPAQLTVQTFPPVITAQPQNVSVQIGGQATFSVTASGTAPLIYQWTFNGTNLSGATAASLTISSAQNTNAGSYTVIVSNAYGSTNASATLTVVPPSGYVIFANNANSATKIFTNSSVGGPLTGLTGTGGGSYYYALYASATATSVSGNTAPILGNAGSSYVFYDNNWTLAAYGKNLTTVRGRLTSTSTDNSGQTPVVGFAGGTTAQFVVIGWSANIGTNIAAVQAWFNGGSPASDGWIGQSAVSGSLLLGDEAIIPSPVVFAANPPALHGFTLGLASPNPAANYPPPNVPPPVLTTTRSGSFIQLSWPVFYSSYGVQSASSPAGPWSDLAATPVSDGTNWSVTILTANQQPFYRLIVK